MKLSTKVARMFDAIPCRAAARSIPFTQTGALARSSSLSWLLVLAVLAGFSADLLAQNQVVPDRVNYQGRLASLQTNKTYIDGLYDIEFRVWDSQANTASGLLWAETYSVYVKGGSFNLVLGEGGNPIKTPIAPTFKSLNDAFHTVPGGTDRFLGITVRQDENLNPIQNVVECAPRQQLLTAPFAYQAQYAQVAASAGAGQFLATNGIVVSGGSLNVVGGVQFNKGMTVSGAIADLQYGAQVEGATTLNGTLTVNSGLVTVRNGIDISGQSTLRGNLDLTSASTTSGGFIPVGGIIMWSGSTAPPGWALCNGTTQNGVKTPDLRGRFVLGSGPSTGTNQITYNVNDMDGHETQTMTVDQMPKHDHSRTVNTVGYVAAWDSSQEATAAPKEKENHGSQTYSTDQTGGGSPFSIMPPYYVLAYIIRVQ